MTEHPDTVQSTDTGEHAASATARWVGVWRWVRIVLQFGIPILIAWFIWNEIEVLDVHRVREGLAQADRLALLLGVAAAFAAVGVMGLYDAVAFPRGVAGRLNFGRRWLLGAVCFGWTNFLSMGPLGGPAIRLVAYRRFGLTGPEVTRGLVGHYIGSSAGLLAWLFAAWLPGLHGVAGDIARVSIAFSAAVLGSALVGRLIIKVLRKHHYGSELDRVPLARLGAVAFFDWGLTLVAFGLLVRAVSVHLDLTGAARIALTGQFAGIVSMIPGGLGTADAVWYKGFGVLGVTHASAAAAIVVFRAGFYLLPWLASLVVLYSVLARQSGRVRIWQRRVVAGAVLLNAILLLLSTATPAVSHRLVAIGRLVPLGAIEVSHLLASLSAMLMILLVRGLSRGYRSAYLSTLSLLIASAIAHLLKGGDFEEAIASCVLMLMLVGIRGAFVRKGRVPIGIEFALAAGVGAVAFFLVAGLASFERIPYRNELWTTFAEKAEASRFLRAAAFMTMTVIAVMVRQAMRPANPWVTPTEEQIEHAEAFSRVHADSADPLLVGGRDKGVWIWESKPGITSGVVLYQFRSDKMIVFKDPVLEKDGDAAQLIDALLQYAESFDVDVVFSGISGRWMEHLHDFGFHFLKVNEEAIVPLTGFSLQGGRNAGFRRTLRDMEKAGLTYELIAPPFDVTTIDQLRAVSDAWLAGKGGRELQFTACCFAPAYLQRNAVGVARDSTGKVLAFVNCLTTRPGGPSTLDLMRTVPDTVDNIMDFVIIRTMQTLAEQGYESFSLGAAPLSEVGVWRHSRLIERAMHVFSKRAERLYNYKGLVIYKNKFHPDWEPRYLAYQQPWEWASSLMVSTRLVQARSRADRRRIAAARLSD